MLLGLCIPFSSNYLFGFNANYLVTAYGFLVICLIMEFIYVYRIKRIDAPLKVTILLVLPALFGLWLALSIAVSCLVGLGYGFFTPWISSFEAFRNEDNSMKLYHCVVVCYISISLS